MERDAAAAGFSVGGVTGTFAGLNESASLTIGSKNFYISYAANGGQDVILTAVPEAGVALSMVGGLSLLLGLSRRRHTQRCVTRPPCREPSRRRVYLCHRDRPGVGDA